MSINLHGKIPSPIYINSKIGKVLSTFTVTFKDGDTVLQQVQVRQGGTAVYDGTVPAKDGNAFLGWVLSEPSNNIVDTDVFSEIIYQQIPNVQADIVCWTVYNNSAIIRDSWEVISQRSQAGTASNYYNVGDMKRIHIEGTVGTLAVNQDVYVYILGFDHNSELEGSGITFGCFKSINNLKDVALTDSYYPTSGRDGTKKFNMNHWGNANYGGWAGSDMRYDILGSTDVAPSGYGSALTSSRVGYNATSTCATNPVANTLMSCLPSDLRTILKPINKYTNNIGNSDDTGVAITSTIDYLPLLSEYELLGRTAFADTHEKDKQAQYSYFANGNSKGIYKYSDGAWCLGWLRSPDKRNIQGFCVMRPDGMATNDFSWYSRGIFTVFLV